MSRFTLWNHGGAVIVGLVLGLISPQLGKLQMHALWFGVLLGYDRFRTPSTRFHPRLVGIHRTMARRARDLRSIPRGHRCAHGPVPRVGIPGAGSPVHGGRGSPRRRRLAPHDPLPASDPNPQPIKARIRHTRITKPNNDGRWMPLGTLSR